MAEQSNNETERDGSDGERFGTEIVEYLMAALRGVLTDGSAPHEHLAFIGLRGCHSIADAADAKRLEGMSEESVRAWTQGALSGLDKAMSDKRRAAQWG
jgi:hypothetical protein